MSRMSKNHHLHNYVNRSLVKKVALYSHDMLDHNLSNKLIIAMQNQELIKHNSFKRSA